MRAVALLLLAVRVGLPAPAQLKPQAQQTGSGVIEGTVINQLTGSPVRKAQVSLGGSNSGLVAVTDDSGRFNFTKLAPGSYWINVNREGFITPSFTASQVVLAQDEEKTGLSIVLRPLGVISGRILDEFGTPLAGVSVNALAVAYSDGARKLTTVNSAVTNDLGEYRIANLQPGRYYLLARRAVALSAAHPLLPRDDLNVPIETYFPHFYPNSPDVAGATRLDLQQTAELEAMDFVLRRTPALRLKVKLRCVDASVLRKSVSLNITPRDPATAEIIQTGTMFSQPNEYVMGPLLPGSYQLIAAANGDGKRFQAVVPIDIGKTPPEPIEVELLPGVDVSGTLTTEVGDSAPANPAYKKTVQLQPLTYLLPYPELHSEIAADGSFVIRDVPPGRYRIILNDYQTPLKAVYLANQQISARDFVVGTYSPGQLRLVATARTSTIEVTVAGSSLDRDTAVLVILTPAQESRSAQFSRTMMGRASQTTAFIGIPPGSYRVYAVEASNFGDLGNRPDLLSALDGFSKVVELSDGARQTVTLEAISASELRRLLSELQ
jgi:uncharacterized protein (DUF2141 family)